MSVGDKLVFDMSTENEAIPSVFVRKDWISLLDTSNGNYSGANTVIETSSISNSNKYANYREGYLAIPLLLTLTNASKTPGKALDPTTDTGSLDYSIGLKNSFLHLIHSLQIELNGTSISQITPFQSLWGCFKLMTTLSWNDVISGGSSIGFYPDTSTSFGYSVNDNRNAPKYTVFNNCNFIASPVVTGKLNSYTSTNEGFLRRQMYINYDDKGVTALSGGVVTNMATFDALLTSASCKTLYKNYITTKTAGTTSASPVFQIGCMGVIMLKHLHNFFDKMPLTKGCFFRITLNLNNTSAQFTITSGGLMNSPSITSAVGGVCPFMIASTETSNGNSYLSTNASAATAAADTFIVSLAVGNKVLNSTQTSNGAGNNGLDASQITLNVPLYSFNPIFESAYLANPIKTIIYEDIYNYNYTNSIKSGASYNFLISNGVSNLKSVLVLPFHSTDSTNYTISPLQSPFDSAGGTTSPLCLQTQFNVVVAGSNAIYNNEKYSYSFFLNQLAGCNSVNDNLTDGICSSLINQLDFESSYNYYYVDISRCLPVEKNVPKSVSITGMNMSALPVDLYCFICFTNEIQIDCLTGGRVA
jgi:hypothetical protein